ncbi:MAG: hypothetical protein ACRDTG_15680 [Pseudonocardiaceae bacterium]
MEVHSEIESRRKILAFRANDAPTMPAGFPDGSIRPAMVTSTVDERDHLVSAPAASVGLAAGPGKSVALCGRLVLAAPLTVRRGGRASIARPHCTASPSAITPRIVVMD